MEENKIKAGSYTVPLQRKFKEIGRMTSARTTITWTCEEGGDTWQYPEGHERSDLKANKPPRFALITGYRAVDTTCKTSNARLGILKYVPV
ncbi:hypothetical protein ACX12E_18035 [Paenibacillus vandeheii]